MIRSIIRNPTVRSLVAIYVPSVVMAFGQGLVIPTVPKMAGAFDVTPGMAAQVVTAVSLGRLLSMLPSGLIVDRLGTRVAMVVGASALGILCLLTTLAPAYWVVLATQFGAGASVSLWQTGREISAVSLVPASQRGRLMAGFFGFNSLGVAIGPVVGGVATDLFGFRAAFAVYAGVALVILGISAFVKDVKIPPRPAGRALFSFGSINEIEPGLRATFVILIASSFADFLYRMMATSLLPLYVVTQRGHSSTDLGALFAVIGAVNLALIVPTGFISDKLGRKAAAAPSAAFLAASYLLFPLAESLPALAAVCFIYACGAGLGNGSKATYSYDVIPEHARGRLQAMRRTVGEVGALTGPILGGVVADAINPGAAFWVFAPLQIAATFLMVFVAKETMGRGRRLREADEAARG